MIKSPRGMSIMEAYELYRKNKLYVNRKYQRKLVWTIPEKQSLIDSIINQYPIPLILMAENKESEFEIIDGMQRLNAIFGFIENEFGVVDTKNGYFNVPDYTFAKSIADKKIFSIKSDVSNLTQEEVSSFISYQFPVTIFEAQSDEDINETFRRINANGKHLSAQEVRQAGSTLQLSELVREISEEIRGDVSKPKLLLSEMPSISIDTKSSSTNYGITADDTFWCKQGILNVANLRDSEDEQFIADIVLSVILGTPFASSKTAFNNYYGNGDTDKSSEAEMKINSFGMENIRSDIKIVFSELFNFCSTELSTTRLKNVLNTSAGSNPEKEAFYTLFMAFYELIIKQNKKPFDYKMIHDAITNLHAKIPRNNNYNTTATRTKNINLTIGLIQDYFKASEKTFRSPTTYIIDFQNYLMKSKVESAVYDYKQGLYNLDPVNRKFSDKTFEEKIIKNIAALANLGKGKKGYLFIGVTDKEEDTLQVEKLDNLKNTPRYYNFGIVGLEREALLKGVTLDNYFSFITEKITNSDLPSELKTKVTKALTPITYEGNTVLMIEVECGNSPIYYKDVLYARNGANCIEVKGSAQTDIFNLFK